MVLGTLPPSTTGIRSDRKRGCVSTDQRVRERAPFVLVLEGREPACAGPTTGTGPAAAPAGVRCSGCMHVCTRRAGRRAHPGLFRARGGAGRARPAKAIISWRPAAPAARPARQRGPAAARCPTAAAPRCCWAGSLRTGRAARVSACWCTGFAGAPQI